MAKHPIDSPLPEKGSTNTPTTSWTVPGKFSKNPRYLHNIYLRFLIFFGVVDLCLWPWFRWGTEWQGRDLLTPIVGIYLGALSIVFVHNATHGSFRPAWLNAWIGELFVSLQPHGFEGWKIVHRIHHQYPDDPLLDPHFPGGKNFLQFLKGMLASANARIVLFYFRSFPQTPENLRHWNRTYRLSIAASLARIFCFVFILGGKNFLLLMIPAIISANLFQTHFNYATHQPGTNGKFEILNLNETWVYKVLNLLLFGIYFHKNHHLNERLFNPSRFSANAKR